MAKKRDVTVKPGEQFTVTDDDRTLGTLVIQTGGQVWIKTDKPVNIDTLRKERPPQ